MPGGGADEDHEPFYARIDAARAVIEHHEPETLEGLEIVIRYVVHELLESHAGFAAVAADPGGAVAYEGAPLDYRDALLLRTIGAISRMIHAQRATST